MSLPDVIQPNGFDQWYRLRSGDLVKITGQREALKLNGKDSELIWYGKFKDGTLCSWNDNGTYRASSGHVPHAFDIVKKISP